MLITQAWADFAAWGVAHSVPLAVHWGDMSFACANLDKMLTVLRGPVLKQEQLTQDLLALVSHGPYQVAMFVHYCNLSTEHRVKVAAFMSDFNFSWHSVDATMDTAAESWGGVRKRGDTTKDGAPTSVEMVCWLAKCGWYLCAAEPGVSAAEVAAALPSIDEIIEMNPMVAVNFLSNFDCCNLLVNMSCVWEKIGRHEDALRYATVALENDVAHSGTVNPSVRVLAHMVQGRAHAALGRAQAAAGAFEAAVELADKYGLWLYQALALKDLKLCVLDQLGHGEHGSRRLGAALRLLVGPAEMLTPMMDGLDVAEMIALSPLRQTAPVREHEHGRECEPETEPEPSGTTLHCSALPEGTPPLRRRKVGAEEGIVLESSGAASCIRNLTLLITSTLFVGKKKVHVSASSMAELTAALQAELRLSAPFTITVYDEDFDEDRTVVELEDFDTDKAKVQLTEL